TYGLGRRLFSPRVGLWAGLILATSLNFGVIARAATPDSILVFFTTLALCCFAKDYWPRRNTGHSDGLSLVSLPEEHWHRPPRWRWAVAAYAAMGIGLLVKGPIGVLLPAMVWGLFVMIMRRPETELITGQGDIRPLWRRMLISAWR